MEIRRDWALPFCLTAWLLAMHAGASDEARRRNFELLYNSAPATLSPPSPRFDPDQEHQQIVAGTLFADVRTAIVNGKGLRRRILQGSVRNTGTVVSTRVILELLEAPYTGRSPAGAPIAGTYEVVASQFFGDLAPGRVAQVHLPFERPDTLPRVYQVRLRNLP